MTNKQMNEWFENEFKDFDKLNKLDRHGLMWQIWCERSNKTITFLAGMCVGLLTMSTIILFK